MKRKITEYLLRWKNDEDKQPLIVSGARQIGKTYSIRSFIKENYPNNRFIEINFEKDSEYKKCFDNKKTLETFIDFISIRPEFKDKDFSINKENPLIIFFDEIQACPNAVTALKFFEEEKDVCHVITSGSSLGTEMSKVSSFPVGYVQTIKMYPMDFEEFMWAKGYTEEYTKLLRELAFKDNYRERIDSLLHEKLMDIYRAFVVVGGMPKAVSEYLKTNNYHSSLKICKELYKQYKNDVSKYASRTLVPKVIKSFESISNQLGQKFKWSGVDKEARAREYEDSINFLIQSNLVLKCSNLKRIQTPITFYQEDNKFKLYYFDTGILLASYPDQVDLASGILTIKSDPRLGGIFENAISISLCSYHHHTDLPLLYYSKGDQMEIDFVTMNRRLIIPVEVKSGSNLASKSLKEFVTSPMFNKKEMCGLKISRKLASDEENIKNKPFYLAALLFSLHY